MTETDFGIAIERTGGVVWATLEGELDLLTHARLDEAIARPAAGETIVVDLEKLSFIDSSGVHALMRLDLRARSEGWEVVIAKPCGHVRAVLDLCMVHERIPIVDDSAALAKLRGT